MTKIHFWNKAQSLYNCIQLYCTIYIQLGNQCEQHLLSVKVLTGKASILYNLIKNTIDCHDFSKNSDHYYGFSYCTYYAYLPY